MDRDTHTKCLSQSAAHLCALAEGSVQWAEATRTAACCPVTHSSSWQTRMGGMGGGITCPLPLAQLRKGKWNTAHAQKLPEGLCVSAGSGGEQVSCFPYCEIRSKYQAPVDPQQWILKWGQSSFIGHRRVLFRCTKCDFGITGFFITSLGLLKPHVLRFELNTFSVCCWLDTQIVLPLNSHHWLLKG